MTKDFIWTVIRSLLQLLVVFATEAVLARALGVTGRGEFATCWSFINILVMVSLFGIESSSTYYLASNRLTFSQVVGACVYIGIGCTVLFSAIGYAAIQLPIEFFSKATSFQFTIVLLMVGPYLFFTYSVAILRGEGRFLTMNILCISSVISRAVLTYILCVTFRLDVVGAIVAAIGGLLIVTVAAAVIFKKDLIGIEMVNAIYHLPKMIHYGFRSFFSYFANVMNIQLGVFIMAFFLVKKDLGYYAIAMAIAARIWIIPDSIFQILMPKLAGEKDNRGASVCRIIRIVMVVVSFAAIGLALISRPLIFYVFGEAYMPVVSLIYIILIGAIFRSAGKIVTAFFFAIDRPGINSMVKMLGLLVNIFILVCLIQKYGLIGGAIGTSISYFIESIFMITIFYRYVKIKSIKELIPKVHDFIEIGKLFYKKIHA